MTETRPAGGLVLGRYDTPQHLMAPWFESLASGAAPTTPPARRCVRHRGGRS